jgi:hypothetical protein
MQILETVHIEREREHTYKTTILLEERDFGWIGWLYWATIGTLYMGERPMRGGGKPSALAPQDSPYGEF